MRVFKTPEQWAVENQSVLGDLHSAGVSPRMQSVGEFGRDLYINERLLWSTRVEVSTYLPVTIVRDEIVDVASKELLISRVAVSAGYDKKPGYTGISVYKFWIAGLPCEGSPYSFFKLVGKYTKLTKGD